MSMFNTTTPFWANVHRQRKAITDAVATQEKQPKNGGCWIVSINNPDRGITAGNVCETSIDIAGQRFAENTHALATDEQIEKELARREQMGKLLYSLEYAKAKPMQIIDPRLIDPGERARMGRDIEQNSPINAINNPKLKFELSDKQ